MTTSSPLEKSSDMIKSIEHSSKPEPKKRTRPVSACESCRTKKVKCNLLPDRPVCENCAQSNKECLFRVDDLSPALRRERFSEYDDPTKDERKTPPVRRRKPSRRESHEATPASNDGAASEDQSVLAGDDESSNKALRGSDGKPIKSKAIFRSFANPNKLAAPSVAMPARALSETSEMMNESLQSNAGTIGVSIGPLSDALMASHSDTRSAIGSIGRVTGSRQSPGNEWSFSYAPPRGNRVPHNSPPIDARNRSVPSPGRHLLRSPSRDSGAGLGGTMSTASSSFTIHARTQREVHPDNGYLSQSSWIYDHRLPESRSARNGRTAYTRTQSDAAYALAHRAAMAMPPPSTSEGGQLCSTTFSPEVSVSTQYQERNGARTSSPGRNAGLGTFSWRSGQAAPMTQPFPPLSGSRSNSFTAPSSETIRDHGRSLSSPRIRYQHPHMSPHQSPRQTWPEPLPSLEALRTPSLVRDEAAPFGASSAPSTLMQNDLAMSNMSGTERAGGGSVQPGEHRASQGDTASRATQAARSPHGSSTSSSTRPPATFKKIALPFFRWFGATANTPGIRRIKVGVYHEGDIDTDGDEKTAAVAEEEKHVGTAETMQPSFAESTSHTAQPLQATSPLVSLGGASTPAGVPNVTSHTMTTPTMHGTPGGSHQQPHMHVAESTVSASVRELFETERPRYPRRDILLHLINLFLKYFKASCFPWLDNAELISSADSGELPAILANSICAMTARFSGHPDLQRVKNGSDAYSDMAKVLIVPMLSWPSIDVIEALVILSYAEFGAGADAGLWMYIGMAMRMSIDVGLQHELTIRSMATKKQQIRARYLFWSIVSLDRITCFGTGRPVTVRDDAYDCQLPPLDDDPASDSYVFGHIVRTLLHRGRIGELLNRREDGLSLEERGKRLRALWSELAEYCEKLPASLHFGVSAFRSLAALDKGPAFVYLHVLLQSTISLINRPSLLRRFDKEMSMAAPSELATIANHASATIVSILRFAIDAGQHRHVTSDEDPKVNPYIDCNPYLDQLILPAGRALLAERESVCEALRGVTAAFQESRNGMLRDGWPNGASSANPADQIDALTTRRQYAHTNVATCQEILDRVAKWWSGAAWPARALRQESLGTSGEDIGPDGTDEDAQPAPIRDVEMVLRWAKARRTRAAARIATPMMSRRGSASAPAIGSDSVNSRQPSDEQSGSDTPREANKDFLGLDDPAGGPGASPLGLGFSGSLGADTGLDVDVLINAWAQELSGVESTAAVPSETLTTRTTFPHAGELTPNVHQQQQPYLRGNERGSTSTFQPLSAAQELVRLRTPTFGTGSQFAAEQSAPLSDDRGGPEQFATTSQRGVRDAYQTHPSHSVGAGSSWPMSFGGAMDMNLRAMQLEEFFFEPQSYGGAASSSQTPFPPPHGRQQGGAEGHLDGEAGHGMAIIGSAAAMGNADVGFGAADDLPGTQDTHHFADGSHSSATLFAQTPGPAAGSELPFFQDSSSIVFREDLSSLPSALFNAFTFPTAVAPSPAARPAQGNGSGHGFGHGDSHTSGSHPNSSKGNHSNDAAARPNEEHSTRERHG